MSLALAAIYTVSKSTGGLTTDEKLYLLPADIEFGAGIYLIQLVMNAVPSRFFLLVAVAALAGWTIRSIWRELYNYRNYSLLQSLFTVVVATPYFWYHTSSYLKDSLIVLILLFATLSISRGRTILPALLGAFLLFLRMPLIVVIVLMAPVLAASWPKRGFTAIYGLGLFAVSILVVVYLSDYFYIDLVETFERQRFSGELTLLKVQEGSPWQSVYILANHFFSFLPAFFSEKTSPVLVIITVHNVVFQAYSLYACFRLNKLYLFISLHFSFLVFTLPQVFPETASRYLIMFPFILFVSILLREKKHEG
ncbi:hypothetical protein [Limimaricola pyoseonensis]|nr:hypothetical protein [Limimaricola pyoseonensis]